jgi:hypothetical protein
MIGVERKGTGHELTITTREKGFAAQHFGKNTSDRPHVDGASVFFECKHDLGRSIPPASQLSGFPSLMLYEGYAPSCHVFRHKSIAVVGEVWRWTGGARKPKVTDLTTMSTGARGRGCGSTLRSQLAFRRRFEGLRSRWRTSAEWRALRARRV